MLMLILLSIVIGFSTSLNTGLLCLSIGLLSYLCFHLYWLNRLHQWLQKPVISTIPSGFGIWEDVFAAQYHKIRKSSRSQSQLSTALERFTFAASALPDAVVVLNIDNQIEWFNDPAIKHLGLNRNHDENTPITYIIRQKELLDYLNGDDFSEPLRIKSWLWPDVTFEVLIIPFGAKQKLLIFRDISAFEKTETMRKDFIANVSHELRTPLTVIGGFLETLSDIPGEVSDTNKPYFAMMQDQTSRMRNIIEDLLTLSKIENSTISTDDEVIDMHNTMQLVYNEAQGLSKEQHHIALSADDSLDLLGVHSELLSAFSNLVSNAIRYTPAGGSITIEWGMMQHKPTFTVRDTGVGIEQAHIDRLTERFYRVDSSRSRDTGGTGLGLSIVKHILNRHKAVLNIESELGQGSTFSIAFPATSAILQSGNSDD